MAEFQTRGAGAGADWIFRPSRPAGLYGELPPTPPGLPVVKRVPAAARKPRLAAD